MEEMEKVKGWLPTDKNLQDYLIEKAKREKIKQKARGSAYSNRTRKR